MNESRKKILKMLADGIITADEAEELLSALDERERSGDTPAPVLKSARGRKPTKLRVTVDADGKDDEMKRAKVNIAIPLGLVRTALPIAMASIPQVARDELAKQNIDIMGILKMVEDAIDSVDFDEDIVNVDAGGGDGIDAKVRVYFD